MIQVSLDTSFLISFADPGRPNHRVAVEYFRHCLAHRVPMWISVVAAGEFEVGQPISDLPLQNFHIQPYNLPHAILAARLLKTLRSFSDHPVGNSRPVILNDLKILAQAEEERIPFILTEDQNTLMRMAERLAESGVASARVLLLAEGFTPGRLATPDQREISF